MSNMTGRTITRRVDETKEGRAIMAYVVLRADGTHVATIANRRAPSGALLVNVVNHGKDNPDTPRRLQWARCGGAGYDKFAHALNGMSVDGVILYDHGVPVPPGVVACSPVERAGGYFFSGLDRLTGFGYRVIQAL